MSKPVIFTISAAWDDEASVWSGHCDDIPAAADAPTLDELLAKISAMALDLLPDNHPDVDPAVSVPADHRFARSRSRRRPEWPRSSIGRCATCCVPRAAPWCGKARAATKSGSSPMTRRNFAVPIGIPSRHTANAILRQAGLPKAF